jgi:uncharacterized repeat protein (TIGR03837 family)
MIASSALPNASGRARRPFACDIFCAVVDNFGDAGVCWRLARQLATEQGWQVRLFIDDLATFSRLAPELDPQLPQQRLGPIIVEQWHEPRFAGAALDIADIVIEAFACDLPQAYLAAMAQRAPEPIWINLEYLSSEDWVADFHLRQSPHPRYPLTKTFFFPGLGAHTGGVIRERDLDAKRRALIDSPAAVAAWWAALGLPRPDAGTTVISLFAYENAALDALLEQWRDGATPLVLLVPEGRVSGALARFFGHATGPRAFAAGTHASAGALSAHGLPFTDQPGYDRLLWLSDINFVRGEDSFVRAQWACRPLVWQIYPQADGAHLPKLDAALAHIGAGLDPAARAALTRFWHAWNSNSTHGLPDWSDFIAHRAALQARAQVWADELSAVGELCTGLAKFAKNRLK